MPNADATARDGRTGEPDGLRMRTAAGRWVLLAAVLGSGLAMLDATVVNVALPQIGNDLEAGFADLQWTLNAYTLTLAALLLLGGSLGDHYGRRRVFLIGVVWFALASALCGLAPNVETLVAARALQGVGGALLTPGSLAIIAASFRDADRSAAVGAWSGLGGVAGALGPVVGGALVEWSWRAVFLINLPVAAAVVAIAVRHVPESRDPEAGRRLDPAGTVLVVVGLGALTWALTVAGRADRTASAALAGVVGVLALAGFVLVERRVRHPLLPPDLFGDRRFAAANAVTVFAYAGLGVLFVLLVLQLQVVGGYSPAGAGSALLPITAIMVMFSARAGALATRIGPRLPMTLGLAIAAVGVLLMRQLGAAPSYPARVLPTATVFGAGLALFVAPLTATVLDSAGRRAGIASGVNNALARAAALLAVAVVPVLAGIGGADYTDPAVFAHGFRRAMLIVAGLLAGASALSFLALRVPAEVPERSKRVF